MAFWFERSTDLHKTLLLICNVMDLQYYEDFEDLIQYLRNPYENQGEESVQLGKHGLERYRTIHLHQSLHGPGSTMM